MSNIPMAFWLDESGLPKGAVVTRMRLTGKVARAWRLNKIRSKIWQLSFWTKVDDLPWKPDDEAIQFTAQNQKEARELAEIEAARQLKTWNSVGALDAIPMEEMERWLDAWVKAHQTQWPNLFRVPKGDPIESALVADLIAMGFREMAGKEIAKLVAKTKLSKADKLSVWLVTNWFHGQKLSKRSPRDRLNLVKRAGFSASEKSVAMRLGNRGLRLTFRNWSEATREKDINRHE